MTNKKCGTCHYRISDKPASHECSSAKHENYYERMLKRRIAKYHRENPGAEYWNRDHTHCHRCFVALTPVNISFSYKDSLWICKDCWNLYFRYYKPPHPPTPFEQKVRSLGVNRQGEYVQSADWHYRHAVKRALT